MQKEHDMCPGHVDSPSLSWIAIEGRVERKEQKLGLLIQRQMYLHKTSRDKPEANEHTSATRELTPLYFSRVKEILNALLYQLQNRYADARNPEKSKK